MELSERLIVEFEESPVWLELASIIKLRLGMVRNELELGFTSQGDVNMPVTPELYHGLMSEAKSLRFILEAPKILREELASNKPPTEEEGEEDERV